MSLIFRSTQQRLRAGRNLFLVAALCFAAGWSVAAESPIEVGAARVDISPRGPVHVINELEENETQDIASPLFARALAIGGGDGSDNELPVVLISYDGIGVTSAISDRVAAALRESAGLPRANVVVAATHTHWAPHLSEHLPYIYKGPLPADHQENADGYTEFLVARLIEVATDALDSRQPCHLSWGSGRVGFAANRRLRENGRVSVDEALMHTWNPHAPVDHRLPIMVARRAGDGALHALWFTYACHNVALTGRDISGFRNRIHGDWAGLATQLLEARHPGAVALVTIGCGGDQRPTPCGDVSVAEAHAMEIAAEVDRLLIDDGALAALREAPSARRRELLLPAEALPEAKVLESWVAQIATHSRNAVARGWAASRWLDALEKDPDLVPEVPMSIHRWNFGGQLSLVFLSGEVSVDYSRLIAESMPDRKLWISAYSNDIPCYIVSRDLLEAGGYEATNSMYYYGWLTPLKPEAEDRVLEAVADLHQSARGRK